MTHRRHLAITPEMASTTTSTDVDRCHENDAHRYVCRHEDEVISTRPDHVTSFGGRYRESLTSKDGEYVSVGRSDDCESGNKNDGNGFFVSNKQTLIDGGDGNTSEIDNVQTSLVNVQTNQIDSVQTTRVNNVSTTPANSAQTSLVDVQINQVDSVQTTRVNNVSTTPVNSVQTTRVGNVQTIDVGNFRMGLPEKCFRTGCVFASYLAVVCYLS